MSNVLVTYASKHHSTEEIVRFIGKQLCNNGFSCEVKDVETVISLNKYDVVIVGSALYMGRWLQSATNFLHDNQLILENKPVWIFSTGPTGNGAPEDLVDGFILPDNIRDVVNMIQPNHIMVFHGKLNRNYLSLSERLMVSAVDAPMGDYRDWHMIEVWTNRIIAELRNRIPQST